MRLFWLIVLFASFAAGQEPAAETPPEQSDESLLVDEELLQDDADVVTETSPEVSAPAPVEKAAPAVAAPAVVTEKKVVPGEEEERSVNFSGYSSSRANIRLDFKRNETKETQPEDDFAYLSNQTLIEGNYDAYTFGVRKDIVLFYGRNYHATLVDFKYRYSPEAFNHGWQHYLDRIYLTGDWGVVRLTVGDFYESMNRGLLFSMFKEAGGEDNAIRGLSTIVKIGDFHAKAFGGMANPYLRDKIALERMKEADDYLWGFEAGYKALEKFDIGVEYGGGFYNDYQNLNGYVANKYYHVIGVYADMFRLIPQVNAYIGATLVPTGVDQKELPYKKYRADLTLANALYFSILNWYDISKSRLTLTVEGKRYERYWLNYRWMEDPDFTRRYFKPPTLMWDNLPLLNPENTMALRTRVQFTDNDITGLTAAVEFIGGLSEKYRDSLNWESSLAPKEDYWFLAGSLDRRIGPVTLAAKAGYLKVNDPSDDNYNAETLYTQLLAGFGKWGFAAKLNLELYYRDLRWLHTPEERNAIEQRHILDLSWKNTVFLSYLGTYYRNVFEDAAAFVEKDELEYHPGGSVGYAYKDIRVSLFGGMMRGGMTCLGGVCRKLPPFKGVKLELDVKL